MRTRFENSIRSINAIIVIIIAAALTLGGYAESSARASSAGTGNSGRDFEVFDPIDNINEVVYGPPQD